MDYWSDELMMPKAYAFKLNDSTILNNSSSGGAFTFLSDYIIANGGYIFGAIYDYSNDSVKHIGGNSVVDRDRMRGSKYIQSKMLNAYKEVADLLNNQKMVLFSGTICQIVGLKQYLELKKIDEKNLICCDIICHGVSSPLIWRDYIKWNMSYRGLKKIDSVSFRDKTHGWSASNVVVKSDDRAVELPEFMKLYYSHTIIRESCHNCQFTSTNRKSDITIGDFWGIENSIPEFDYKGGCSFLMSNSEKGETLISEAMAVTENVIYKECTIEDVRQPNFYLPTKKSVLRDRVWRDYKKYGIDYLIGKYASSSKKNRMIVLIDKIVDTVRDLL